MEDQPTQRRLVAVLIADIAGYTRLMEQDTDDIRGKRKKLGYVMSRLRMLFRGFISA